MSSTNKDNKESQTQMHSKRHRQYWLPWRKGEPESTSKSALEELETVGGRKPFLLDRRKNKLDQTRTGNKFEWDGLVNEEAHLDLD